MRTDLKIMTLDFNNLNNNEWSRYEKHFENLIKKYELNQESFEKSEREKINKLIGKFYAIETKRMLYNTNSYINDLGNRVEGFIDEIEKYTIK